MEVIYFRSSPQNSLRSGCLFGGGALFFFSPGEIVIVSSGALVVCFS
jgi:hypothetical protein